MPLSKYFGGRGERVMKDMQGRYGAKKGKSVFYATANKEDQAEKHKVRRRKRKRVKRRGSGHPTTDRIYRRERKASRRVFGSPRG